MTGLGASIYVGFFALAALWLFLTSDGPLTGGSDDQGQRPLARQADGVALDRHRRAQRRAILPLH